MAKKLITIIILISFCWQQVVWAGLPDTLRPPATANRAGLAVQATPVDNKLNAAVSESKPRLSLRAKLIIITVIILSIPVIILGLPFLAEAISTYAASGIFARAFKGALIITAGDFAGRIISKGPKHNAKLLIARSICTFISGFIMTLAAFTLISGITVIVPKKGLWSFQNLLRAFLIYIFGAIPVSLLYSFIIPGHFAKKAVFGTNLPNKDKIIADYTPRMQLIKTYEGVRGRWPITFYNYLYMTFLPWGWLTRELGWYIGVAFIGIYAGFRSGRKETGGWLPFITAIWNLFRHQSYNTGTEDKAEKSTVAEFTASADSAFEAGPVAVNLEQDITEAANRKVSIFPTEKLSHSALLAITKELKQLIGQAGDIMNEVRKKINIVTKRKPDGTVVTEADERIEKLVDPRLVEIIPGSVVIGEESCDKETVERAKKARYVWLVDPLDGTDCYEAKKGTEYGIAICLLDYGKPILSVFYAPNLQIGRHKGCLFEASALREGAYLNGKRIHVSNSTDFKAAICNIHSRAKLPESPFEEPIIKLFGKEKRLKKNFSTSARYCMLAASGNYKNTPLLFTKRFSKLWDIIPGAFILEKAGGIVMYPGGRSVIPLDFNMLIWEEGSPKIPSNIACSLPAKDSILTLIAPKIEIINKISGLDIKAVALDWDDTLFVGVDWRSVEYQQIIDVLFEGKPDESQEALIRHYVDHDAPGTPYRKRKEWLRSKALELGVTDVKSVDFYAGDYISRKNALRERVKISWREKSPLIPGALDFLRDLRDNGISIYLITAGGQKGITEDAKLSGVHSFCKGIYGGGMPGFKDYSKAAALRDIARKENISDNQLMMIGDSKSDMEAAIEAGVVATGFARDERSRDKLFEAGANIIINNGWQYGVLEGLLLPNLEELEQKIKYIIADKIDKIIIELRGGGEIVAEEKADGDSATIADEKIGILLRKKLSEMLPSSIVIEEEGFTAGELEKAKDSRFVWVVDPIDDTKAFRTKGNNEYCVAIALLDRGRPILSIVYSPEYELAGEKGCLFEARDDLEGAYLNGQRLYANQGIDFAKGLCITHTHTDDLRTDLETAIADIFGKEEQIKAYKGHSTLMHYCLAATGIHDGPQVFTRRDANIWDVVQAAYIFEKAGGVVIYPDGQRVLPLDFNKVTVKGDHALVSFNIACSASANKKLIDELIERGTRGFQYNLTPIKELQIRDMLVRLKNPYLEEKLLALIKDCPVYEKKKFVRMLILIGAVEDVRSVQRPSQSSISHTMRFNIENAIAAAA